MRNTLKWLLSVVVVMLAVGCADVSNAPETNRVVGAAAGADEGLKKVPPIDEVTPDFATAITIAPCGGGENATYCETIPKYTRYRVPRYGQITVCGRITDVGSPPTTTVTVTLDNLPTTLNSVVVPVDPSGNYTATIPVGPGRGDNVCVFGSAIKFRHTYDVATVVASCATPNGTVSASLKIYILVTDERVY